MKRLLGIMLFVAFALALGGATIACQPCDDPSQLWCPDQW